jgi:hypothetical protein
MAVNNFMKIPFTLTFFLFSFFTFGQKERDNNYKSFFVGHISNLEKFEKMTKYELSLDSLYNKNIRQLDSIINKDEVVEPSYKSKVTPEEKEEMIEYMKAETPDFGKNRSRYYFNYYKNNKIDKEALKGFGDFILNSPCDCVLSNDTIKVRMGIWVFGGFAFEIDIGGNKFSSRYIDDKHDIKVYKLRLSDTLDYSVTVNNTIQDLTLNSKPNYIVGQNITGYFKFQTDKYYSLDDENNNKLKDGYSENNMDIINLKGYLYFKCKVRKKIKTDR